MSKILEVKNLRKSYGEVKAVKGISFYAEEGKLFSFLGPNGAGKSTTIDMICTFLKHDSGSIRINDYKVGEDDVKIRNDIGVVFQDSVLDALLTVEENLKARGSLYGLKGAKLRMAVTEAAGLTGITDLLKRPYGKLSGGQRRRCDIARALIHTPKILFLDEPTTGLDPQTRKYIWETIGKIQRESNMTIFLTTHYMEEAAVSDYIVVIDNGEVVAEGTPSDIKDRYSNDRLILTCSQPEPVENLLSRRSIEYKIKANTVEVPIKDTMDALPIIKEVQSLIIGFEVIKGTMDDAFITITGKEVRA